MTNQVTLKPIRYQHVFVCAVCGLLACSPRSDATTCSTACRVSAHRSGSLKRLREIAAQWDVTAALLVRAQAAALLTPALEADMLAGTRSFDNSARQEIWAAFQDNLERLLAQQEDA